MLYLIGMLVGYSATILTFQSMSCQKKYSIKIWNKHSTISSIKNDFLIKELLFESTVYSVCFGIKLGICIGIVASSLVTISVNSAQYANLYKAQRW